MNKKNTILTIIIITLILLINITTTAATDNNTTDNHQNNTHFDNIDEKNIKQESVTTVKSYDELKKAVDKTNDEYISQTINLDDADYNITEPIVFGNGITPLSITINGNNNTLNGLNSAFITVKRRANLTLNNITITNINAAGGCCINNIGNTILNNVIIKNINSTYNISAHGSIFSAGSLNINNSRFENMTYTAPTYGGGVIFSSGILNITNTLFKDNTATRASTIYSYNSSDTTISNSTFINNHAYEKSTVILEKSNAKINDCHFENNTADNYSEIYLDDNTYCTITNSIITNSKSNDSIIYNYNSLNLINTTISNTTSKKSTILNLNNTKIYNSNLKNNTANFIIYNEEYSNIYDNTSDVYNTQFNTSTQIESLLIKDSILNDNTADILIDGANSSIQIISTKFINNTINELFDGTNNTLERVSENTYLGNKLKSFIKVPHEHTFNYDEKIIIKGNVTTKEIYNTTLNLGRVSAYYNDTLIASANVENGSFILLIDKLDNKKDIDVIFFDFPNYVNSTDKTQITVIPEMKYEVLISNIRSSVNYNDSLEYDITVKNIGKISITNLNLYNILAPDLTYINSSNENIIINPVKNSLTIDYLDVGQTVNTTVRLRMDKTDDFIIHLNISDDNNKSCLVKEIPVKVLKSLINASIDCGDLEIMKDHSVLLKIENIGNASTNSTDISFTYNNKTIPLNIDFIDVNQSLIVPLKISSENIGPQPYSIEIIDKLFNNKTVINGSFNFIRESVDDILIEIENVNTYANKTINITAIIRNMYSYKVADCIFKINHITLKNETVVIDNNNISLLNYLVPANWSQKNYTVEVKIRLSNTNISISNTSLLMLNKANVYSSISVGDIYPGKIVNLKAIFYDEFGYKVQKGVMIFKLNGKTISSFIKINDGLATLDYLLLNANRKLTYNFSVAYGENSRYLSNRNSTLRSISKQECEIIITNTTFTRKKTFSISANIYAKINKYPATSGKVVFKINGKTVSPIINVTNGNITYTIDSANYKSIDKITVSYSGNNLLYATKKNVIFS